LLDAPSFGDGAAEMFIQPDSSRVACTGDNYALIIDLKSLQVAHKPAWANNPTAPPELFRVKFCLDAILQSGVG
jgi:hypothetical protein